LSADPYDVVPTFWDRHSERLAPGVVGVLSAVLLVAAFPRFPAHDFAYACLVPGIFWAYQRPRFKVYAWTLLLSQAVAWTVNLWWLHPVTWAGPFLLGPLVGAWTGTWFLAAWWTMPRMLGRATPVRLVAMLGLAGAWVIIEWTRTWFFFGGFPWMPLAATQYERISILQVAAYTGAGGVSFVLVAVNIGVAAYAHRLFLGGETGLRRRSQEFLLALFLLLGCLSIQIRETTNQAYFREPFARVAFVQPYIPARVKWVASEAPAIVRTLESTTLAAGNTRPDLILWPESTTPWPVNDDPSMRQFVERLAAQSKAYMLIGADAIERPDAKHELWHNAAFIVDPQLGLQTAYYSKQKLVPFGEYVPLRPVLGWIDKFVPLEDDASPGDSSDPLVVPLDTGAVAIGVMICYEDVFPGIAREEVRLGADALAVLTNDAWYGEAAAAYQHAASSVLRAVETRRPVLRCGNGGWSGWIDEFGNIRKVMTDDSGSIYFRGTMTVDVTRDKRWVGRRSFYVEHGDWFVAVCAGLVLMGAFLLGGGPVPGKTEG
jgi:apolipoprotein N-acyltransferase